MASVVNVLGDVHGGAGEQSVEIYLEIASLQVTGASLEKAMSIGLNRPGER